MLRREFVGFVTGVAATAALPRTGPAEAAPGKISRIGFLGLTGADSLPKRTEAFRAGLRDLGYPVEQVTRFATILNLATAKALGLSVPPLLLLRADEVI
jgi:putative ABC transport system substrate-binding protein